MPKARSKSSATRKRPSRKVLRPKRAKRHPRGLLIDGREFARALSNIATRTVLAALADPDLRREALKHGKGTPEFTKLANLVVPKATEAWIQTHFEPNGPVHKAIESEFLIAFRQWEYWDPTLRDHGKKTLHMHLLMPWAIRDKDEAVARGRAGTGGADLDAGGTRVGAHVGPSGATVRVNRDRAEVNSHCYPLCYG